MIDERHGDEGFDPEVGEQRIVWMMRTSIAQISAKTTFEDLGACGSREGEGPDTIELALFRQGQHTCVSITLPAKFNDESEIALQSAGELLDERLNEFLAGRRGNTETDLFK